MKLLEETPMKKLVLKNRVVMEPMCMYSVHNHDGIATDFHFAHYVSRAIGQVGLIIVEATGVSPEGRITDTCLGLWNTEQMLAMKRIVDAVHEQGSKIIVQLNHAGRKCTAIDGIHTIYGPSEIAFSDTYRTPEAVSLETIASIIEDFKASVSLAFEAGFDGVEIHAAHGYLISQFMSPISNQRTDHYQDGSQFLQELTAAIKPLIPEDKLLNIRVSSTDFEEKGLDTNETIRILDSVKTSYDVINVSTGGITPMPPKAIYPGYQVEPAIAIKQALGTAVIACGMLGSLDLSNYLIESGAVDFIGLARPLLENPNWVLQAYQQSKLHNNIPYQYRRGFRG